MKGLFTILAVLSICTASGRGNDKSGNDLVGINFSLNQKEFKAGGAGYFLISFKPKKGIHITTDPPFHVSLDTAGKIFSLGKVEFSQDASGYVDPQKSVLQRFTIAKTTPPGSYELKGILTYYYCSDEAGWCSKFKQPIHLTFTLTK